ncbi:hypothetical protein [Sporomusa ovata]|uniref:Uncharacterized protein n=1 Tax=Sporomusa ovata TaxID=2378 RepID=A0A0U1L350_9FIRM|nr:hypothetical protein [Sporomusa ovata]CQR73344.1 hypothetical protein SpAn4DRAFT_2576 [Sporomusa ovata]
MAKKKYCAACGAKIAKGKSSQMYDESRGGIVDVCDKPACWRRYLKVQKGAVGA